MIAVERDLRVVGQLSTMKLEARAQQRDLLVRYPALPRRSVEDVRQPIHPHTHRHVVPSMCATRSLDTWVLGDPVQNHVQSYRQEAVLTGRAMRGKERVERFPAV